MDITCNDLGDSFLALRLQVHLFARHPGATHRTIRCVDAITIRETMRRSRCQTSANISMQPSRNDKGALYDKHAMTLTAFTVEAVLRGSSRPGFPLHRRPGARAPINVTDSPAFKPLPLDPRKADFSFARGWKVLLAVSRVASL